MSASAGVSPYATGGGGTVLEHHFGAVLLSHLLTQTPVPGLGDHVTPVEVRFQARAVTAVDDYVVTGRAGNGALHYLSIAVRRRPRLAVSDSSSVELMRSFLATLQQQWAYLCAGRWHLALAVAAPFPRAASVQTLTTAAAAAGSAGAFRHRVAEPGRLNKSAHRALWDLQSLISAAVAHGAPDSGVACDALTWRLLAHLSVLELRLEGVRPVDRTAAVERLQSMACLTGAADGDALFSRLRECASDYAPAGATVNRESLLRALRGAPFIRDETPKVTVPLPRPRRGQAGGSRLPRVVWSHPGLLRPHARQPRVHDGTLLVVDGHVLHALDTASGKALWKPKSMGYDNQPPVDGTTVFASAIGSALRPRSLHTGLETGPRIDKCAAGQAVCARGTLYVPDLQGVLHVYDTASGRRLWSWRPEPAVSGFLETPRVVGDCVFVTWTGCDASRPWTLLALDTEKRRPRWAGPIRLASAQRWLVSADSVYVISPGEREEAPWLSTYDVHSGAFVRREQLPGPVVGMLSSHTTLHLAHQDGHVSSWNALSGENRWTVKVAKALRARLVAAGEEILVAAWDPGRIFVLSDATGEKVWDAPARPAASFEAPAYVTGGAAWAVSRAGVLQGWDLQTRRRLGAIDAGLVWEPAEQGVPQLSGGVLYIVTKNGSVHAIRLEESS
ncbi:outer membrane protein assembly factor BamB [Streptomyces sp. TLI_55]|uniref:outer membrane protein assembly factor BamB family protein n=1 Tax=Streptomyces sp. TLI_55 TaxID=1938861 RepID=UPI000BDBFDA3|nr:PQQ-binding-like beta-propeller repeat protein [Streptomyces sp. TLI_55]SNX88444.1 outer membrane protein assembly factor BamB [Streptomyces sp. TLI_55]